MLLAVSLGSLAGCGRADDPVASADETPAIASPAEVVEVADVPAVADDGGLTREQTFIASLTIFALAVFVGFELITKVPPTLHTPLMSGSNAISGISIVGAAIMAANDTSKWAMFFGLIAVIMASVNVVGGFMVTDRMLSMFKKK
jgi:NAD(P) transhydrogenase subunit alpha